MAIPFLVVPIRPTVTAQFSAQRDDLDAVVGVAELVVGDPPELGVVFVIMTVMAFEGVDRFGTRPHRDSSFIADPLSALRVDALELEEVESIGARYAVFALFARCFELIDPVIVLRH